MFEIILFCCAVFLAYSNGANDNFKGVATLYGGGVLSYRSALSLATVATAFGSVCSVLLAGTLIQNFSGRGLVPDSVTGTMLFHFAVVVAVAVTVLLATRFGFPISTTHAIVGALLGAGFMAVGMEVNLSKLGTTFFLPLLSSPLIAILFGVVSCNLFRLIDKKISVQQEVCACVSEGVVASHGAISATIPIVVAGTMEKCEQQGYKKVLSISKHGFITSLHCLSAGAVCFARALNDTPKIVALMFVVMPLSVTFPSVLVALGMAFGGLLHSRKLAETLGKRIVKMNETEGVSANIVTSLLVIFASRFGLPVSTTHVSVGALVGVGLVSGKVDSKVFSSIFLSWVLTLPIAAFLSGLVYSIFR